VEKVVRGARRIKIMTLTGMDRMSRIIDEGNTKRNEVQRSKDSYPQSPK